MMHFSLNTTLELFVIIGISFWKIAKNELLVSTNSRFPIY